MSECPGDFVGIRRPDDLSAELAVLRDRVPFRGYTIGVAKNSTSERHPTPPL
jgi:hypothetical protein